MRGQPEGYWSKLAQIVGRTRLKVRSRRDARFEGQTDGRRMKHPWDEVRKGVQTAERSEWQFGRVFRYRSRQLTSTVVHAVSRLPPASH